MDKMKGRTGSKQYILYLQSLKKLELETNGLMQWK